MAKTPEHATKRPEYWKQAIMFAGGVAIGAVLGIELFGDGA